MKEPETIFKKRINTSKLAAVFNRSSMLATFPFLDAKLLMKKV
jgi:hypothetical protein